EFLCGLVQHAHSATRVALLRANDRANVVAELLVLGKTGGRPRQNPVRHVGLAAQQREVRVVLGGASRALSRETVAVGDLAALHSRAGEAQARVPPDRGPVS